MELTLFRDRREGRRITTALKATQSSYSWSPIHSFIHSSNEQNSHQTTHGRHGEDKNKGDKTKTWFQNLFSIASISELNTIKCKIGHKQWVIWSENKFFLETKMLTKTKVNSGNKYKGLQKAIENAYYRENYMYIFNIFAPK